MQRKTLIILFVILLVLIGIGIFVMLQKSGPQGSETDSGGGGFLSNLIPFGSSGNDENNTIREGANSILEGEDVVIPTGSSFGNILQLTNTSVSGFISSTSPDGTTFVRYIDKASGNIFDVDLKSLNSTRITNTTLPGIEEVVWHKNGEHFVLRFLNENDVIKTFLGKIREHESASPGDVGAIEGTFLKDNIITIVDNPSGDTFLYLTPDQLNAQVFISGFKDLEEEFVFHTDFSEWRLDWNNEDSLVAVPRSTKFAEGFVYTINLDSGRFEKVFGGNLGLYAIGNSSGNRYLYSESVSNAFFTNLFQLSPREKIDVGLTTLVDKCVWSNLYEHIAYCAVPTEIITAEYPDMWYQGVVSFDDVLWEINAEENMYRELTNPNLSANQSIDAIEFSLDRNEEYLFFVNKKDSTLWSLKLETPSGVTPQIEEEGPAN